jgi:hypothetical protein
MTYLSEIHSATLARRARLGMLPPRVKTIQHDPIVSIASAPASEAAVPPSPPPSPGTAAPIPVNNPQSPLTVVNIQHIVCAHFGVTREAMLGPRRLAPIVWARHVAMYLARTVAGKSFPEVGRFFGGRDHTTALHAWTKVANLRASDVEVDQLLAHLESLITRTSNER